MSTTSSQTPQVASIFERLRGHAFHPLDADRFTVDRHLGRHGIADLNDRDWRLRLLAVRDLVRCGRAAAPGIAAGLGDADLQVRYAAATALGILRADEAVDELERVAREDDDALARSPAVVALGEMESRVSLDLLRECRARDSSRDVRHQAELAIYQIERRLGATRALEETWRMLDDSVFDRVEVGETAPDFTLANADGEPWCLREVNERGWVVLIWIFAHWCPVCHREFSELIELREEFERHHVQVATLECHDRYRCRVMTGRELEPDYWFADDSFQDTYTEGIWWPHLSDRAGAVGARHRPHGFLGACRVHQPPGHRHRRPCRHRPPGLLRHLLGRPAVHRADAGDDPQRPLRFRAPRSAAGSAGLSGPAPGSGTNARTARRDDAFVQYGEGLNFSHTDAAS